MAIAGVILFVVGAALAWALRPALDMGMFFPIGVVVMVAGIAAFISGIMRSKHPAAMDATAAADDAEASSDPGSSSHVNGGGTHELVGPRSTGSRDQR